MRRFTHLGCLHYLLPTVVLLTAALQSPAADRSASAAKLGILLRTSADRLWVVQVNAAGSWSFRPGDQIVAVNGRRVSTEAALMNRVTKSGAAGSTVTIARGGRLHTVTVSGAGSAGASATARSTGGFSGGFLNKSQMVMTSQGAMHIEAAERLGLPHTPFPGGDH